MLRTKMWSTDQPTDRQVQSNIPLFFEGGHNKVKVENAGIVPAFPPTMILFTFLILFQTNPGFYVSAAQVFLKTL